MDCVAKQMFFFIFYNSSPTCRGRRILAIYYVKHTHTSCTFLLQLSWGLHLQFFPFADYPCAILVTTFPFFLICRLSPALYLWPHLQFFPFVDYLCSIFVTAFAIFLICRLSSPPNQWPHSQFFSFADYLLRHTSPTTVSGDAYRQDYPPRRLVFPLHFVKIKTTQTTVLSPK